MIIFYGALKKSQCAYNIKLNLKLIKYDNHFQKKRLLTDSEYLI